MKSPLSVAALLLLFGCGQGAASPANDPAKAGSDADAGPRTLGTTFATAEAAPKYAGSAFAQMQIYDGDANVYLDEAAFLEALDDVPLAFFGEQHETAPVQELELWLLERMTPRHDDVTLAMEHFQHDEQPILDAYVAGSMSTKDFEAKSQPWQGYATYWKPLVEHMKSLGRPVVGLNIPDEALETIYAAYPKKKPLEVFNAWDKSFKYDGAVAPRPVGKWDETYKSYFEGSFDYKTHGAQMGMSPADALLYFTDLAHIRDETMGYFAAKTAVGGGHVLVVAGDWHVQTGLATPARAARYAAAAGAPALAMSLITTTSIDKFEDSRTRTVAGHKCARYFLVYR